LKGLIVQALEEMCVEKYSLEVWKTILKKANIDEKTIFLSTDDIDDKQVLNIINILCSELKISLQQAFDAFGEFWVCSFGAKRYFAFYNLASSARDFILKMDEIHIVTGGARQNAKPPRFFYEWKSEKTLLITYSSQRGLADLAVSLLKGVAKYYKESLVVNKISPDLIEVVFA
jgi:hypothetical protein